MRAPSVRTHAAYRDRAWRSELHVGFFTLKYIRLAEQCAGGLILSFLCRQSASLALTATSVDWDCSHLRSTATRNHPLLKP